MIDNIKAGLLEGKEGVVIPEDVNRMLTELDDLKQLIGKLKFGRKVDWETGEFIDNDEIY